MAAIRPRTCADVRCLAFDSSTALAATRGGSSVALQDVSFRYPSRPQTAALAHFSLDVKPSLRRRDLVDYANAHENIAAVVIDSREGWETLAQDRSSDPWKHLACPLVTAAAPDKKSH